MHRTSRGKPYFVKPIFSPVPYREDDNLPELRRKVMNLETDLPFQVWADHSDIAGK